MKILKFYSDTCAPCKTLTSLLEGSNVEPLIEAINTKNKPEIALQYNIRKVPTLVFVDEQGVEKHRETGVVPAIKVKEIFDGLQGNKTD